MGRWALWGCLALGLPLMAEEEKAAEAPARPAVAQDDYYLREEIPLPPGAVMELSGIAILPEKKVAVATRRGEIWICEGAYAEDLSAVRWQRYAHGLHEPLGMYYRDGSIFVTQRPELTRLSDRDGDGRADVFETLNQSWGINGDYHEYAFGSSPDKNGDVWVALCLTGSFNANSPWRGWAVRVTPEGEMIPTVGGVRSPGGIGFNAEGDLFYTDNQGPWNGSSSLKWLKPGSFQGNPSGNHFYKDSPLEEPVAPRTDSRIVKERERIESFVPPAVVLPHAKLGQSPTAVVPDLTKGAFGPFARQVFVGEQTHSQVQRVFLEKVNGLYQGAVWHFLDGFRAGIVPMKMGEDATLFVGGTNRGWASRGGKPFTFERVRWTGKVPFEMKEVRARADGFEITFTEEIDAESVKNPASYELHSWTYLYRKDYGSPEVDASVPVLEEVVLGEDGRSIRLKIKGLVKGNVHSLHLPEVRAKDGRLLWHPTVYYTLNEIPQAAK